MIYIKDTDSVVNCTKSIYKKSLIENTKRKEWTIDKMKKYGSVDNFHKQRESGEDYFKRLGWN